MIDDEQLQKKTIVLFFVTKQSINPVIAPAVIIIKTSTRSATLSALIKQNKRCFLPAGLPLTSIFAFNALETVLFASK